jgi:hypothetical protein
VKRAAEPLTVGLGPKSSAAVISYINQKIGLALGGSNAEVIANTPYVSLYHMSALNALLTMQQHSRATRR